MLSYLYSLNTDNMDEILSVLKSFLKFFQHKAGKSNFLLFRNF